MQLFVSFECIVTVRSVRMYLQSQQWQRLNGRKSMWPLQSITPTTGIVIMLGFVGVLWVSNGQSYENLDTIVMQTRELRATAEQFESAQSYDSQPQDTTTVMITQELQATAEDLDVSQVPHERLDQAQINAEEMSLWRQNTEAECKTLLDNSKGNLGAEALEQKSQLEQGAIQRLSVPQNVSTGYPVQEVKLES
jgi:hypothetical protein